MSTYEPLHHKYRPKTFADLVGQEAIAQTLTNAINRQRIAPAYLFTGPRGTGKTSSARILAKSLNCLSYDAPTATPCGKCEVCRAIAVGSALDVIEIDAASNTGVDNIREIIERAQFAPVQCRYKVYVIDECHMLSTAAFNALLKTLEEPPERVIFVLATTDPQRVLPTIISRCQRFDYRRIPLSEMVSHLSYIATQENIEITDEAVTLVAQIANGGLRDAESLLDQLSLLSGEINSQKVWDLVGAVSERDLLQLIQAIHSNDAEKVLESCRDLMNRGREPLVVLQNLAGFYLNLLIAKTAPTRADLVAVTTPTWEALCNQAQQWDIEIILQGQKQLKDSESQIKNTTQPRLWLEVTLLSLLPSAVQHSVTVVQTASPPAKPSPSPPVTPSPSPPVTSSPPPKPASTATTGDLDAIWQAFLGHLPPFIETLVRPYAHLIKIQDAIAIIGVKNENWLKNLKGKQKELESALEAVLNRKINIQLKVATEDHVSPSPPSPRLPVSPSSLPVEQNGKSGISDPKPQPQAKKVASVESSLTPPPVTPAIIKDDASIDIQKAVEYFAKCFEGEVVRLEESLEATEVENTINLAENITSQSSPSQNIIIKGRPEISEDEEDIPF